MEDGRIPSAMAVVINTSIDSRRTPPCSGITSQASGPVVVDGVRAMKAITAMR